MKFLGFRSGFGAFVLSVALLAAAGCSQRPGSKQPLPIVQRPLTSEVSKFFQPLRVNTVYIYPLERGLSLRQSDLPLEQLQTQLVAAFDSGTSLDLVNGTAPAAKIKELEALSKKSAKALRVRATDVALSLDAQGVLFGVVNRYQSGVSSGGGYAAVSFKLWLVEPKTGDTLWSATFENSEESLSENLLKIKDAMAKGFRFRSVEELSQFGFQSAAAELEDLRAASRK